MITPDSRCAARTTLPLPEQPNPAFEALLADRRAALRKLPSAVPIAALREGANAFMASAVGPAMHAVEEGAISGPDGDIPIRIYRPVGASVLPVALYVHGGGFLLGSLDSHDALCRSLARYSSAAVVAIDYRLAPEVRFPAPLHDITTVFHGLKSLARILGLDIERCAIAGDSAGGQLAAAAALELPMRHLGLFYPMIDPSCNSASLMEYGEHYMLTRSFIEWAWEMYGQGKSCRRDPRFDLRRADPRRLPPTTLVSAGCDPLRDEAESFAVWLKQCGVDVMSQRFTGMIHGFAGMPQLTVQANAAIAMVARRIAKSLN